MKELDRSGELLALCYREQWPKATQLLTDANLTASTVASALHQAVIDSREEVLLFVLETARRDLLKVNTSVQKDGKTLLHLALESNNLRFVHALLSADADVAIPDKKGVRPMDLMTWTAVIHPTVMVPLQDNILHLQQWNERQHGQTSALNEMTASLQTDERKLLLRANETQEDAAAARAFRAEVDEQIRRAQVTDCELSTSIEAEEVKIQWIRGEVARLHTQNGTADLELARINEDTERFTAAAASLREKLELQQRGRDNVAAHRAVKCEMISMLRQFPERASRNSQDMQKWRTKELVEALLAACTSVEAGSSTTSDEVYRTTSNVFMCLKKIPQLNDVKEELCTLLDAATHRLRATFQSQTTH
ncbi:hypothetical protein PC118_g3088 [Phytophthora cactorum]|uniref:Ankyrin repeat-containing domain n=1 Tax=Phytophthora cactorum TaxID=29920 RepID=A0A8T1GIN0_9STRA|nr:hypothetical protein PC118_g3088 [Phytophthora cactorum]